MWDQVLLQRTREDGDFVLASGVRSPVRFDCSRLTPRDYEILAGQWLHWLYRNGVVPEVDLFVAVAHGGVPFAHELARQSDSLYGQSNKDGSLRGQIIDGFRAIVVEDVVTTGLTTGKVIDILGHLNVKVEGVASIIWRRDIVAKPDFRLWPLTTYYGD